VAAPLIEVRELSKRFGRFTAVDRVSFDVEAGEILGYLGANGAGKSTTIRMLCGLLAPTSGTALVAGIDVARRPEEVKRLIGYMSQRFSLYLDLSARENLEFFGGAYGLGGRRLRERTREVLGEVDLSAQSGMRTGDLPGGWRQRLALACAILHQPRMVFLDEPTAGVDPAARRSFWTLVRRLAVDGTTILVTTHYMDEAEYCDRVGMMVDGRLAALDTPAGLKQTFVPGRLFEVRGAPGPAARTRLEGLPGVLGVEPFGTGFHLRMPQGGPGAPEIAGDLARAGCASATVEALEPTLEDVFLAVVGATRAPDPVREAG
jgi:ABC-2 type transport system ATP-binding protein